jgi:hypothetical protein
MVVEFKVVLCHILVTISHIFLQEFTWCVLCLKWKLSNLKQTYNRDRTYAKIIVYCTYSVENLKYLIYV